MTALITVWRDGTAISCGRSCYSAKHKACRCPICGGLNHGKGREVATANTRRHAPEWAEAAGEGAEVELDPSVQQDPLFLIGDQPMPEESTAELDWEEAGCARRECQNGHSRRWGRCAYGVEPPPTLSNFEVFTAPDGEISGAYVSLSVEQVADWLRGQGYTVAKGGAL